MRIQIDAWQLDTKTRELHGVSGSVRLRPQIFKALTFLIDRAPSVVSKEDLLEEVWDSHAVSDSAIAQVIRELRVLFDDDSASPRIIATRHRQGYQLIAEVQVADAPAVDLPDQDSPAPDVSLQRVKSSAASPDAKSGYHPSPDPARRAKASIAWITLACTGILILAASWFLRTAPAPTTPPASDGWPQLERAQPALQQGLTASRALNTSHALDRLQKAQSLQDTPRLNIHIARLLVRLGRSGDAKTLVDDLHSQRDGMARRDQLFADAVQAEAEGKLTEAARLFTLLTEMHPEDIDFVLARWETDPEAEAEATLELLRRASDTKARQQLIAVQAAGRQHQPEEQLEAAEALMSTAAEQAPILATLAQIEKGRALRSLGQGEASVDTFQSAGLALQRFGEMRAAYRALRLGVDTAASLRRLEVAKRLLASYEEMVDRWQDPVELARLPIFQGRLAALEEDNASAAELFTVAAQRCESIEAWIPGATALSNRADVLQKLGRLDEAEVALRTAMRWSESSQLPNLVGQAANNLANYFARRGDFRQAQAFYDRSLSSFRQGRYTRGEAAALNNLARLAYQQGRIERSLEHNDAAGQLFRQMDLPREQAMVLIQSARSQLALGDLEIAQQMAREALDYLQISPSERLRAAASVVLSRVALRGGQVDAARAALDALDREPSSPEIAAQVLHQRARLALETGSPSKARELLDDALARFPAPEVGAALPIRLELAYLDLESGRPVESEQTALDLLGIAERGGRTRLERQAAALLTQALLAQDNVPGARQQLQKAKDLLAKAPDFQGRLELALVEVQMETTGLAPPPRLLSPKERDGLGNRPEPRRSVERLHWVLAESEAAGHRLVALQSRVELARLNALDASARQQLALELERAGLERLNRRLNTALEG